MPETSIIRRRRLLLTPQQLSAGLSPPIRGFGLRQFGALEHGRRARRHPLFMAPRDTARGRPIVCGPQGWGRGLDPFAVPVRHPASILRRNLGTQKARFRAVSRLRLDVAIKERYGESPCERRSLSEAWESSDYSTSTFPTCLINGFTICRCCKVGVPFPPSKRLCELQSARCSGLN
jgi:hypothetical protein